MDSRSKSLRRVVLSGVAISFLILIPGLFLPVLTVKGTLNPGGVADLANKILEEGLTDSGNQQFSADTEPRHAAAVGKRAGGLKGAMGHGYW